jgi:5-methylcytosine-specific restriction protein A
MPATAANPQSQPWRTWYSLQRWRRRARHQLRTEPLCCLCETQGRVVPAEVADHFPAHGGDWNAFLRGPLRSLCKACHDGLSGFAHKPYSSAIGDDGLPLDPNHPFNRAEGGRGSLANSGASRFSRATR